MAFRKSSDVIARREGTQTLVFHQKTGAICILNPCSTFIWESLDEYRSADEVKDRVRQHFEVPTDDRDDSQLLRTIEKHLDLMHKAELVEVAGP